MSTTSTSTRKTQVADLSDIQSARLRVAQFFAEAESAPAPQCIESAAASDEVAEASHEKPQIEINMVMGVFEEKPNTLADMRRKGDIVIPTASRKDQMRDEDREEAEALARLMQALLPDGAPYRNDSCGEDESDDESSNEGENKKVRLVAQGPHEI